MPFLTGKTEIEKIKAIFLACEHEEYYITPVQ